MIQRFFFDPRAGVSRKCSAIRQRGPRCTQSAAWLEVDGMRLWCGPHKPAGAYCLSIRAMLIPRPCVGAGCSKIVWRLPISGVVRRCLGCTEDRKRENAKIRTRRYRARRRQHVQAA